jgi:hypothetical protein
LYVTAHASPDSLAILFLRQSPRAVLERFAGSRHSLNAPEWTRMALPTVKFQQPKATFVAFFLRMATWSENQSEVRLLISAALTKL